MSVKKDKTLARVRTFAQDFKDNQPIGAESSANSKAVPAAPSPTKSVEKKPSREKEKSHRKPAVIPKITVKDTPSKEPVSKPQKEKPALQQREKRPKKTIPKTVPKITVKTKPKPKKKINTGAPAEVITATKRAPGAADSRSLFTNVRKWLANVFRQRKKAAAPTYSVGSSTYRKGVIKKATTKSGAVFTGDTETLREAIVRRRTEQEQKPDLTWTPHTDTGYGLLEAPHDSIAETDPDTNPKPEQESAEERDEERWVAQPEPKTITAPEVVPTPDPKESLDLELPGESDAEERWVAQPETKSIPEPNIEPEPQPEPASSPLNAIAPEPAAPVDREALSKPNKVRPLAAVRDLLRGQTESLNTNAVALGVVAIIAGTLALVLVVQSIDEIFFDDRVQLVEEPAPALLPGVTKSTHRLASTDRVTLFETIQNADQIVSSASEEIEFVSAEGMILTPSELISLLNLNLDPNFSQSITTLHLVVVDTVQHGIVMEVTDPFTALGGMLEWETTMQKELDPILFTRDLPLVAISFVDQTYGNIDMRVLTDGESEVLVYGFVDEDIILVTKTTETFERLAN